MGERKDDAKPATTYAVRDVGAEVLGRVPLQKVPTPPGGSRRDRARVEQPTEPDLPAFAERLESDLLSLDDPPSEDPSLEDPLLEDPPSEHPSLGDPSLEHPSPEDTGDFHPRRRGGTTSDAPHAGLGARTSETKPKARRARRALQTDHVRASIVVPRSAEPPERTSPPTFSERAVQALTMLRGCGPGEDHPSLRALLALGPDVLDFVEADFPGLLWFHRHLAHRKLPRGRDIGPLGALLVAFGADALPSLTRLLDANAADTRYYATLVASDLLASLTGPPRSALAEALGERLFDADSGVRDAACHGLLATGEGEVVAHVASRLRTYAADLGTPRQTRLVAVRALGALRCVEAVPDLIPLLDDREPTVREMAQRALRLVCATDLGTSIWRWRRWWKKHAGERRSAWLLEGLDSKDAAVRAIAQRELARETGHDEPFDAEAPRAERRRIRDVYRSLVARAE
ncbi:MAG: HEAT repeat domain-containing protein [Myxococcales bacterium]|nr:HEAT repeat domain-containing protein [Myxococcales bacterium]